MITARFHMCQMVRYRKRFIPYFIIHTADNDSSEKPQYAIVETTSATKPFLDRKITLDEIIKLGFKIKYDVKEEDLEVI